MNEQRLNRFKKLLSVPSKSRNESQMVNFICTKLDNMIDSGVNHIVKLSTDEVNHLRLIS